MSPAAPPPLSSGQAGLEPPPSESAEELYEHAPCGYITTAPDGTLLRVNQTFLDWMGYSREELLGGRRFQELLSPGGRIFHETHYAPLLRMQGAVREINFDLVRKDGQRVPMLVNTVEKKNAEGRPELHRTSLFNITERKSYERELLLARQRAEALAQSKADFLSMMSHEIRTPLNAVIGLANLLTQADLPPQQQQYASILHTSSESLLGLLNNLLDLSKLEAHKAPLEERPFQPRQLLYNTLYAQGIRAEQKELSLRLELDERLPGCLLGDPVKLGQVLNNLISNALKFTEQGSVTVAVRVRELDADAATVDFEVSDTGIGMSAEQQARLFEEYSQASYEIGMKYGGTGLGLSICQKLLHLHGTRLEVRSTQGQGSAFSFRLRLRVERQPAEPTGLPLRLPDSHTLRGVRVLVAEDNAVNVFVLSQFLRKWGVRFDVAGTGRLALEQLQAQPYELVLMDLQMPDLNGHEATRAVRALPGERFQRLPIIALSASTRLGMEERLDASGFTDFVGKPFQPEELFAKLVRHSGREGLAPPGPAEVMTPKPALEPQSLSPAPPRFSLEGLWKMAEGDPDAFRELGTLALQNAEAQKQEARQALVAGDLEAFEFMTHKAKMTMELLQARALKDALREGRLLLAAPSCDEARRGAILHTLQQELDALIQALRAALR